MNPGNQVLPGSCGGVRTRRAGPFRRARRGRHGDAPVAGQNRSPAPDADRPPERTDPAAARRGRRPAGSSDRRAAFSRDALRPVLRGAHDGHQCSARRRRSGSRHLADVGRSAAGALRRPVHELPKLPPRRRHGRRADAHVLRLQPPEPRAAPRGRPGAHSPQHAHTGQRPAPPGGAVLPPFRRRVHDARGPRDRDDDRAQLRLAPGGKQRRPSLTSPASSARTTARATSPASTEARTRSSSPARIRPSPPSSACRRSTGSTSRARATETSSPPSRSSSRPTCNR